MNSLFDVSLGSLGLVEWALNAVVVLVTAALLIMFARPWFRSSDLWQATVTPLASIIGSGFLVVAPLLGFTAGTWALLAMAGIVGLAYLVGGAVRYNIGHVEDITESTEPTEGIDRAIQWLGRGAKVALAVAYVVAVTFYLELLGAFILRLFGTRDVFLQKLVATALIAFIAGFGFWKGLRILEWMEKYAVDTKLSIIGGFLVALVFHNLGLLLEGSWSLPSVSATWDLRTVRELLGAFLIVQGFETSRYLRGVYEPEHRIRTMRYAQWLAAGIYLAFMALATVLLGVFDTVSETGIITLSQDVAFTLPILLVVGAVMSQFSAAVADTIGSGGLVEEVTRGRVHRHVTYAGVGVLALGLLWTSNIFSVIAYASRAFALYYAIQCAIAALHAFHRDTGTSRVRKVGLYSALALLMVITAVFGIPAESSGGGGASG